MDGTFSNPSSRLLKENFVDIDGEHVLDLLDGVEVSEWSYIRDPETRHIGPIAEDFWAAFGLGKGATLISPLDVGGISLVSIKTLNQKIKEQQSQINTLENEIAELKAMVRTLAEK